MGEERDAGREPRPNAVRVAYGISPFMSNTMMSSNPFFGIYNQPRVIAIGVDLYNQTTTGGGGKDFE